MLPSGLQSCFVWRCAPSGTRQRGCACRHVSRALPHRSHELTLQALTDDESAELVRQLLQTERISGELRGVLERAAGTPLWVEELVHALVERGVLASGDAGWESNALPISMTSTYPTPFRHSLWPASIDWGMLGRHFRRRR